MRLRLLPLVFLVPDDGSVAEPQTCEDRPEDARAAPDVAIVGASRPSPRLSLAPSRPDCTGDLVILDEEGLPVDAADVVVEGRVYLQTDAEGRAEWPDRPCGLQTVTVRLDDTVETFADVWVRGGEDLVLVWPRERYAVLRIVGPDCAPWDETPARSTSISAIDRLGDGRFRVWSTQTEVGVEVRIARAPQSILLPMDEGEHTMHLVPPRIVDVETRCPPEGCAPLWCSLEPCAELGAGHVRCPCPEQGAELMPKFGGPNRPIADDAATILVDLSQTAGGAYGGAPLPDAWPTLQTRTPSSGCEAPRDTGT